MLKPAAKPPEWKELSAAQIEHHLESLMTTSSKELSDSAEFGMELVKLPPSRNKPLDLKVGFFDKDHFLFVALFVV